MTTIQYHIAPLVVSNIAFGVGAYQATDADSELVYRAIQEYGFLLVGLLPAKGDKLEVVKRFTFSEFADVIERQASGSEKIQAYLPALRRAHALLEVLTKNESSLRQAA